MKRKMKKWEKYWILGLIILVIVVIVVVATRDKGEEANNTSETKGDYPVSIKALDKEGNEIVTVGGYIINIRIGKSIKLNCSASFDYANA